MTIMKRKETNITTHNDKNLNSCKYPRKFKFIKLKNWNNMHIFIKKILYSRLANVTWNQLLNLFALVNQLKRIRVGKIS